MVWDTKTLVDDESDTDSIAPMEIEEQLIVLVLYCAFCKWGDEEAKSTKAEAHILPARQSQEARSSLAPQKSN